MSTSQKLNTKTYKISDPHGSWKNPGFNKSHVYEGWKEKLKHPLLS